MTAHMTQAEVKHTESEWRAIDDLRKNWERFCDCDPFEGSEDFAERMESAGYCELRPVTDDDLETPFAYELGIEPGGSVWDLTAEGLKALYADGA